MSKKDQDKHTVYMISIESLSDL